MFAIANAGTGVPGTSCAGMAFSITQIPGEFGQLRFTPVSNQHVQLLGRGTLCRVAFTFDVVQAPKADESQTPGVQTAQIVENLQWGGVQATDRVRARHQRGHDGAPRAAGHRHDRPPRASRSAGS